MVITQSRTQSLLNRTIKVVPVLGLSALTVWAIALFSGPTRGTTWLHLAVGGAAPLLAWLWLAVFERGAGAAPETELRLDSNELRFARFEQVEVMSWDDYWGYRLTWELPPRIRIRRGGAKPILIDFFAFSREQRSILVEELRRRAEALPNKRLKLPARVLKLPARVD